MTPLPGVGRLGPRVVAAAWLLLVLLQPGAALGATPPASLQPTGSHDPTADPSPAAAPVVRLLDPGSEPRSPLRYRLEPNTVSAMTMDTSMTVSGQVGDLTVPAYALPTMRVVAEVATGGRALDGTLRVEFRYVAAGAIDAADDAPGEYLEEWTKQMVGVSGWWVIDDLGRTYGGSFDGLGGLDPTLVAGLEDMERSLDETSTPFPVEPVGVGARWVVESAFVSAGLDVTGSVEYALVQRDADAVTLRVEVRQAAVPGPAEIPGSPGSEAWVTELTSTGTGTVRMSLDTLVPTSDMEMTSRQVADIDGSELTTETRMRVRVRPGALPVGRSA